MKNRAAKILINTVIGQSKSQSFTVDMRVSNRRREHLMYNRFHDLLSHYGYQTKKSVAQSRALNRFRVIQMQNYADEIFDCTVKPVSMDFLGFNGDGTANISLGYVINPEAATFSWKELSAEQIVEEMKKVHDRMMATCQHKQAMDYFGGNWNEIIDKGAKEAGVTHKSQAEYGLRGRSIERPESLVIKIEGFNSRI